MEETQAGVFAATHPLVQHKIRLLRKKETNHKCFRDLVKEISSLLIYEATRNLPIEEVTIETPCGECKGKKMVGRVAIVPVLRAGLGMMEGAIQTIPSALIWHLGFYRDEDSLKPVAYYNKLENYIEQVRDPDMTAIVVDPMLATGGTLTASIQTLKNSGSKNIIVVAIIGAPEGVATVKKAHPEVPIYLGSLDKCLNDVGFIMPGLGDAGDRQFGTQ